MGYEFVADNWPHSKETASMVSTAFAHQLSRWANATDKMHCAMEWSVHRIACSRLWGSLLSRILFELNEARINDAVTGDLKCFVEGVEFRVTMGFMGPTFIILKVDEVLNVDFTELVRVIPTLKSTQRKGL